MAVDRSKEWARTKHAGISVRHRLKPTPCAWRKGRACDCDPSYRTYRGSGPEREVLSKFKTLDAAQAWKDGADEPLALSAPLARGMTLGELIADWRADVEAGVLGRLQGDGGYSSRTWDCYCRDLDHLILPERDDDHPEGLGLADREAEELDAEFWQEVINDLKRKGLKRSRIRNILAPISVAYRWAKEPGNRRRTGITHNPTAEVRWPPKDETPRLRVCTPSEVRKLLDALKPDSAKDWPRHLPFAIAFYAGLRLQGIRELDWQEVDFAHMELRVLREKSAAGRRGVPMVAALADILRDEWIRQNAPESGRVVRSSRGGQRGGSFNPGGRQAQADELWSAAGLKRLTFHECRHTYASWLMASNRYTLREMMAFMGHSSTQAFDRYVKQLPERKDRKLADGLNDFLASLEEED